MRNDYASPATNEQANFPAKKRPPGQENRQTGAKHLSNPGYHRESQKNGIPGGAQSLHMDRATDSGKTHRSGAMTTISLTDTQLDELIQTARA